MWQASAILQALTDTGMVQPGKKPRHYNPGIERHFPMLHIKIPTSLDFSVDAKSPIHSSRTLILTISRLLVTCRVRKQSAPLGRFQPF